MREIPVYELLDDERVELVHQTTMRIVEETGIDVRDEEALRLWREAGAEVCGKRVHVSPELLMNPIATVPEEFEYHARNAERNARIGGRHMVFGSALSSPTVVDLEGVRRLATLEDLRSSIKPNHGITIYRCDGGFNAEPVDVPVARRHLHMLYASVNYSDKPFMEGFTSIDAAQCTVRRLAPEDDSVFWNQDQSPEDRGK